MTRIELAYLTAPLGPATLLGCALSIFMGENGVGPMILIAFIFFGYLGSWVLGPLLVFVLKKVNLLSTLFISIGGAVLGFLIFYLLFLLFVAALGSHKEAIPSRSEILWGSGLGFSVALSFGLIAGFPLFKGRN